MYLACSIPPFLKQFRRKYRRKQKPHQKKKKGTFRFPLIGAANGAQQIEKIERLFPPLQQAAKKGEQARRFLANTAYGMFAVVMGGTSVAKAHDSCSSFLAEKTGHSIKLIIAYMMKYGKKVREKKENK